MILPSALTFETAAPERIEIVAGRCRVTLAGTETTREYGPGQQFSVPGNSSFRIEALEPLHYVCHFG